MRAFVFPGQGSQSKGMGGSLFDRYPEYTNTASEILGYSIKELCIDDPAGQLGNTEYTQPALFVVGALSYLARVASDPSAKPDFLAGHSLGEYNALFAAGAIDFEAGLLLVKKRGQLMAAARDGGMAAVLGFSAQDIERLLQEEGWESIDIANLNAPTQIVISGPKQDILNAQPVFEKAGCFSYIPLAVSGAFHSSLMVPSRRKFKHYVDSFDFKPTNIPVIANVTARPYSISDMKELLASQISSAVKWTETVQYLMGRGVEKYEQLGPGDVVIGLVKKIKREAEPIYVLDDTEATEDDSVNSSLPVLDDTPSIAYHATTVNAVESNKLTPLSLGCADFKGEYGVKYAYIAGAMVHGIASETLVIKMAKAGMLSFFGAGGLDIPRISKAIDLIQGELGNKYAYGFNLLNGKREKQTVELYLERGVHNIEAAAYIHVTEPLAKYRILGLERGRDGTIYCRNKVLAKVSRPEVAAEFLAPASDELIQSLLRKGLINTDQAEIARNVPIADDICVESDSGGHTDMGVASVLLPSIIRLRDEYSFKYAYEKTVRVGAAGGIGTPEAVASAFILGADFVLTGSINQCSVESGTSDLVKEMLQNAQVQDMTYAPAGDMFEVGAKVQVLKKGVFFPARANKLFELYRHYDSLDEMPTSDLKQLEDRYFGKTIADVYSECKEHYSSEHIEKLERLPKQKMAAIFKWYIARASRFALSGEHDKKVDFQIQCGPALGAFNKWVKGTELELWRNRHVDVMAKKLLEETSTFLNARIKMLTNC